MTHPLVQDVEDELRSRKPELADRFNRQFDHRRCDDDKSAIVALNDHFRTILVKSQLPTVDERGCLRDDLAPGPWFKYFKSHVVPTLVRFNLPSE